MTITHQILTDAEGKPVAAQIPWTEFRVIQAELERSDDAPLTPEWKAELDRRMENYRNGTAGLTPHEKVMEEVREVCRNLPPSKQSA
jgi:putative addiction module component (TIGR02574 family)